jgi:hypothetical protein
VDPRDDRDRHSHPGQLGVVHAPERFTAEHLGGSELSLVHVRITGRGRPAKHEAINQSLVVDRQSHRY